MDFKNQRKNTRAKIQGFRVQGSRGLRYKPLNPEP
jgi:hypothetical protein